MGSGGQLLGQMASVLKKRLFFGIFLIGLLTVSGIIFYQTFLQGSQVVQAESTITISITNVSQPPPVITIETGGQVTWINPDTPDHAVTSADGNWTSGVLHKDQSYTYVFSTPGIFHYHYDGYTNLQAKITVVTSTGYSSPTPHPSRSPTPRATPSATPVLSATPRPTPPVTPQASASLVPTLSPTSTPLASPVVTTEVRLCKYSDDNGNGWRDSGESVLSWKFTVWVDGEGARIIESHWWNVLTQGCATLTLPIDKTITVEEEQASGWRHTGLFVDGGRVDSTSFTYTSRADQVKVFWFLDTFTPVGGTPVMSPTPSPVTTNTQSECVSLSGNPTFGGARLTVSFIGKGRDLDGIIRQMEFNFGDSDSQRVDVAGETNKDTLSSVSHTYVSPGTYYATLRVKDNSGQSNEWSSTPESCKVKIDVQGVVIGTTTTVNAAVTQLPKAGVDIDLTLAYFLSAAVGLGLKGLARKWETFS